MIAAWFSVLLAAGAATLELTAFSRRGDCLRILSWMALVHAAIGLGEAIITGMVVRFLLIRRPELLQPWDELAAGTGGGGRWVQTIVAGIGISLAVAIFLAPFASEQPDGLEFVGRKLGFLAEASSPSLLRAPIPDYQLPLPGLEHVKLATALAGLVGTLVVFAAGWGMARVLPHAAIEGQARGRAQGAAADVA
jgi:cobalt/nickel transport system permease protein